MTPENWVIMVLPKVAADSLIATIFKAWLISSHEAYIAEPEESSAITWCPDRAAAVM